MTEVLGIILCTSQLAVHVLMLANIVNCVPQVSLQQVEG